MQCVLPYDPALLESIPSAAHTVGDVLSGMHSMDARLADTDGLKWFHWLYLRVTENVADRIGQGDLSSARWLSELDVQFANLYFHALRTYLEGERPAGCWRAFFARRSDAAIARVQFAMAGINAHINHDLPIALVATCQATGATPTHGNQQYLEYTAVNPILEGLIEEARRDLHVRLLGDALPPVSHLENTLGAWSVAASREAAWTNAEILWEIRGIKPLSARFLDTLDGLAALAGKTLLSPVPL